MKYIVAVVVVAILAVVAAGVFATQTQTGQDMVVAQIESTDAYQAALDTATAELLEGAVNPSEDVKYTVGVIARYVASEALKESLSEYQLFDKSERPAVLDDPTFGQFLELMDEKGLLSGEPARVQQLRKAFNPKPRNWTDDLRLSLNPEPDHWWDLASL